MTLHEKLNHYRVRPTVTHKVVTLAAKPDAIDQDGADFAKFLSDLDKYDAYISPHPEGVDRGGYVAYVEDDNETCFFCPHDHEWIGIS